MIQVFVDESGNMGRGGKYFVLAAAVFDTPKGCQRADRIIRKEQLRISKISGLPPREIKSCRLSFVQRQRILNKIVDKADIDIFYLVVDKPKVTLLQQGKPKNLVYNYFAKLLMDSIFSKYNDDYNVIFDQRSTVIQSMNSLTDYITINAYTAHNHVNRDIKVRQMDSRTQNNLQIADIIAGSVFQAYKSQSTHFLDIMQERIVKADEFPRMSFSGGLAHKG